MFLPDRNWTFKVRTGWDRSHPIQFCFRQEFVHNLSIQKYINKIFLQNTKNFKKK